VPTISTVYPVPADSLYSALRTRLAARSYGIVKEDNIGHRVVASVPGNENTQVEFRVVAQRDSSALTVTPLGNMDPVTGIGIILTVTHDITTDLTALYSSESLESGELPPSRWRPELCVTPWGRLWLARGGLYTADSLLGNWRRAFGGDGDPVPLDDLRIGISMAFPADSTALLGLPDRSPGSDDPLIYRTSDGGRSWSPVNVEDIWSVDAMAAIDQSVWVLATRWEREKRRGTFLRSNDGGVTWERPTLPADLNDVTQLYRVSRSRAYAATAGHNQGPVFWRTADGGDSWKPIPSPHDQGVHSVPSYGVRVEEIATVGGWLVVREYGTVFVSPGDTIRWRQLEGIEHVAADHERDRLFVLTDSLYAAMLDPDLGVVWQTRERVTDSRPTNIEKVLARDGVGYVSMSQSTIYEARDGVLRLVHPKGSSR
jgi:hypothetical protein